MTLAPHPDHRHAARFKIDSMISLHAAIAMARGLPFMADLSQEDRVLISTVVSELGTNIIKFAGCGSLSLARVRDEGHDAIQVIAKDSGPGIRDVESALAEGFSTSGTLGLGLSAVRRIMSSLRIHTQVGEGTTVIAAKWLDPTPGKPQRSITRIVAAAPEQPLPIEHASLNRPYPGQRVSGDLTLVREVGTSLLFGVIDVSGHGPGAHGLARELGATLMAAASPLDLEALLRALHAHCQGTRGAAAGLAVLNRASRQLTFAGVGNVHIRVIGRKNWHGVSRDGILGERMRNVLPQSMLLEPGNLVVVASDGCSESAKTRVLIPDTPLSAVQIAEKLITDTAKSTDDAACVVVKCL